MSSHDMYKPKPTLDQVQAAPMKFVSPPDSKSKLPFQRTIADIHTSDGFQVRILSDWRLNNYSVDRKYDHYESEITVLPGLLSVITLKHLSPIVLSRRIFK